MSIEQIPGTDQTYYLIAFDPNGRERDDPAGIMTQRVAEQVAQQPISDVFLFSHGGKGDIPSARADYGNWLAKVVQCSGDIEQARRENPGFRPLFIGLHWPSQPWGDEEFSAENLSFAPVALPPISEMVDRYAKRVADTPAARSALAVILTAARQQPDPPIVPAEVQTAYTTLNREANLGSQGEGAEPGADREPFMPEDRYQLARDEAQSFGIGESLGNLLLSPLRQLSFWKMKDRARRFGESGAHDLLGTLLAVREGVRLHLMGHSFGCIVMSAAIAGPAGGTGLSRPVQSLALVQGAMSLWSYCSDIPYRRGTAGYFSPVVDNGRVAGPIITTRSTFDLAVGRWYPLAAGVARQIDFALDKLPRYGGSGAYGLRGPGLDLVDLDLLDEAQPYGFKAGQLINLECSRIIRKSDGASGAHSDIAHPEIAHAIWAAALV